MEVHHDEAQRKFWVEVDGYKADMAYVLGKDHWIFAIHLYRKRLVEEALPQCW